MTQTEVVLIVEPDADSQALFRAHLGTDDSLKMLLTATGAETVEVALKQRPKVILMETQLPDKPGMAIFRQLQGYPRTSHIPVIFLAGGTELLLRNQILSAGAYDVIAKPLDVAEIGLRLRNTLRRTQSDGRLHPETRLPTGSFLIESLANLPKDPPTQQLTLQIAHFEPFKEQYGFIAAREVLNFVSNVICEVIHDDGTTDDFIGHRQENEFIIVTQPDKSPILQTNLKARLDDQLPQFYTFAEREQGYLEIADGKREALMTLVIQAS